MEPMVSLQGLTVSMSELQDYHNPEEPTFFMDFYKEIKIRHPKRVGYSGLRKGLGRGGLLKVLV